MDDLRQLLWWPSLPATSSFDFESSTSPTATSYRLLGGTRNFTVGDTLRLGVQARDHHGRDKRHGGDYFRIKVYSQRLRAGVFGSVLDHDNGSYTASVVLPWPGEALVDVKLVHSSEAVHIMSRLRDSVPNKIFFTGYFEKEGARGEATECNAVPHLMIKSRMCEYRDAATGHMWFCKKPRTLPCDTLRFHSNRGRRNILTKQEDRFFSNEVSKVTISGDPSQIEVQPSLSPQNLENVLGPCVPGHPVPSPSGFYLNDEWVSLSCKARPFPTPQDLANCLSNKRFYIHEVHRHQRAHAAGPTHVGERGHQDVPAVPHAGPPLPHAARARGRHPLRGQRDRRPHRREGHGGGDQLVGSLHGLPCVFLRRSHARHSRRGRPPAEASPRDAGHLQVGQHQLPLARPVRLAQPSARPDHASSHGGVARRYFGRLGNDGGPPSPGQLAPRARHHPQRDQAAPGLRVSPVEENWHISRVGIQVMPLLVFLIAYSQRL
ncbi:NXPE family member 3-like isoform X3 [Lampetra planeri]